jgi:Zn-dependent peptidase ImmA (M78 family)
MQLLKVTSSNRVAIAAIAASLRRRAEQNEPAFSTRQIIDVCYPGTIVTGRTMPRAMHELVLVDEAAFRSHRAPHTIFYSRTLPTCDQRYAIAHALAHIIFDGANGSCWNRNVERERRCDAFADELLVPLETMREYIAVWPSEEHADKERYLDQVDQIASHFHVPQRVIDRRIRELETFVKK